MFGNFLIDMAAKFAGLSPQQLAKIESAMPATRELIALVTKAQPIIEKVAPLINEMSPVISKLIPLVNDALPLIDQAIPIVEKAAEEIHVVGPALEIILDAIESNVSRGQTRDAAIASIHQTLTRIDGWA